MLLRKSFAADTAINIEYTDIRVHQHYMVSVATTVAGSRLLCGRGVADFDHILVGEHDVPCWRVNFRGGEACHVQAIRNWVLEAKGVMLAVCVRQFLFGLCISKLGCLHDGSMTCSKCTQP